MASGKKKETIEIPLALAKLLASKDLEEDVREVARALLALLISVE